jgi:hypothetical protein
MAAYTGGAVSSRRVAEPRRPDREASLPWVADSERRAGPIAGPALDRARQAAIATAALLLLESFEGFELFEATSEFAEEAAEVVALECFGPQDAARVGAV